MKTSPKMIHLRDRCARWGRDSVGEDGQGVPAPRPAAASCSAFLSASKIELKDLPPQPSADWPSSRAEAPFNRGTASDASVL